MQKDLNGRGWGAWLRDFGNFNSSVILAFLLFCNPNYITLLCKFYQQQRNIQNFERGKSLSFPWLWPKPCWGRDSPFQVQIDLSKLGNLVASPLLAKYNLISCLWLSWTWVSWWLGADLGWVLFLQNQYSKFLGFWERCLGFAWFPTQVSFLSFGIRAQGSKV